VAVNALADVGHREAPGGALQQPHAELVFQLADAPAQARFGNARGALGGREAPVLDHQREVVQVIEVLHSRSFRWNDAHSLSRHVPYSKRQAIRSSPPM
jgi:hypothetical protein